MRLAEAVQRVCGPTRKIANQKDSDNISISKGRETHPKKLEQSSRTDQRRNPQLETLNWLTKRGCIFLLAGMRVKVHRIVSYRLVLMLCPVFGTKPESFWAQICWNFDVKVQEIRFIISYKSFMSCHGCWEVAWESFNRPHPNEGNLFIHMVCPVAVPITSWNQLSILLRLIHAIWPVLYCM